MDAGPRQTHDNPGITPERLRSITASFGGVGSNEYRVKVLGEFPLEEEDGVIPRDIVVEAIERHVQPLTKFPVVWGFDPRARVRTVASSSSVATTS